MKTIIARYPGTCADTGARILPGDVVQWTKNRVVLQQKKSNQVDAVTLYGQYGPRTYYQNARGRCIDAPCCGCCTM